MHVCKVFGKVMGMFHHGEHFLVLNLMSPLALSIPCLISMYHGFAGFRYNIHVSMRFWPMVVGLCSVSNSALNN